LIPLLHWWKRDGNEIIVEPTKNTKGALTTLSPGIEADTEATRAIAKSSQQHEIYRVDSSAVFRDTGEFDETYTRTDVSCTFIQSFIADFKARKTMSTTSTRTRRCKRIRTNQYVYDEDLIDQLLEEAEEVEIAAAKEEEASRKSKKNKGSKTLLEPVELIPEVLGCIFSFCDSRSLLSVSMASKGCRALVTTSLILRAAVFGSKHEQRVISHIMELLQNNSIFFPGTRFRLLRLVLATRCERNEECVGFNLVTQVSKALPKSLVGSFGLAYCSNCHTLLASGNVIKRGWRNPSPHPRLVTYCYSKKMMCQPVVEAITGDLVGPLVSGMKVRQILASYSTAAEQRHALDDLFGEIDKKRTASDKEEMIFLLDAYEAVAAERTAYLEKLASSRHEEFTAAREDKAARKRELAEPVLAKISHLVGDYCNRHLVDDGEWCERSGIFVFRFTLARQILGKLLSAPSNTTHAKIQAKVQEVRDRFDLLSRIGIGSGVDDFLTGLALSNVPHVKAIYEYRFGLEKANYLMSQSSLEHGFGLDFVDKVRYQGAFAAILPQLTWDDKQRAFLASVAEVGMDALMKSNYELMAKAIWGERLQHLHGQWVYDETHTVHGYCRKFDESAAEYRTLSTAMKAYLHLEPVQNFRGTTGVTLTKMFKLQHGSRQLLKTRSFKKLYRLHKSIFHFPANFTD
jgi:hypothetical protein